MLLEHHHARVLHGLNRPLRLIVRKVKHTTTLGDSLLLLRCHLYLRKYRLLLADPFLLSAHIVAPAYVGGQFLRRHATQHIPLAIES